MVLNLCVHLFKYRLDSSLTGSERRKLVRDAWPKSSCFERCLKTNLNEMLNSPLFRYCLYFNKKTTRTIPFLRDFWTQLNEMQKSPLFRYYFCSWKTLCLLSISKTDFGAWFDLYNIKIIQCIFKVNKYNFWWLPIPHCKCCGL